MTAKKIITALLLGLSIPAMADTAHDSVVWENLRKTQQGFRSSVM